MRRPTLVLVVLAAALAVALPALAASPHFKKNGVPTCTDTGATLSCSGALAGLGNADVILELSAAGQASFACVNPGGNEAPGQNKVPFTASNTVTIPGSEVKNGNLSFTISAPKTPPTATPEEAGCPNGNWTTRLRDVEFGNVTLKISQTGLLFTCTYPGQIPNGGTVTLSCTPA